MFVSIRSVLGVSTASLHHLFQGFPILTRPGRISLPPHLHLPCRYRSRWAWNHLGISLYPPLFEIKHLFFPSKLDTEALLTAFLLWTFFDPVHNFLDMQLDPNTADLVPSPRLSTMKGCSTNKAELQEMLGVKNILTLIKMQHFALSRRVGSRPGEQIRKGHGATAL